MLYDGCDQEQECPICGRVWVDLGGLREPVIDLEDPRAEDSGDCDECGGGW